MPIGFISTEIISIDRMLQWNDWCVLERDGRQIGDHYIDMSFKVVVCEEDREVA